MEFFRRHIEAQVQSLTGLAIGGVDYENPPGDAGLFGPDSVCWKVHGDFTSMLIGGISALLLQALHPLALAGVWDHSNFREDLLGRLRRTGQFISATTFGSHADAQRLIDRVRTIHLNVTGHAPDGRPYAASDPDLLTWVHVAEVSSFLKAHLRYLNPSLPVVSRIATTPKLHGSLKHSAPATSPAAATKWRIIFRHYAHNCSATSARGKFCAFCSTHLRPAYWPSPSAH